MTAADAPTTELKSIVLTDVGMVRDHNEDAAFADGQGRFFIVADGMGGHAAGEVASAMAVETVKEELLLVNDLIENFADDPSDGARKKLIEALERAVRNAHQAVYDRGLKEADKQGMGTTLDVLLIAGGDAFVAHVGDSRTYLIRDGKAAQITTDHTVAEVLVIEGKLSVEEAAASPLRTILVNAIGVAADVGVEMAHLKLRTGDYFLLCSDGLHDYFPAEQEIADHTLDAGLDGGLGEMIELAKERGGHDNITGVLIEVLAAPAVVATEEEEAPTMAGVEAVPREIARDDTMPVDVDEVIAKEERKKLLEKRKTEEAEAQPEDSDDDEDDSEQDSDVSSDDDDSDDEDSDDEASDDDSAGDEPAPTPPAKKKKNADLKTTIPIRPMRDTKKKS